MGSIRVILGFYSGYIEVILGFYQGCIRDWDSRVEPASLLTI